MVWIRTLLTIITSEGDNVTHTSQMFVNSTICPANFSSNYSLCSTEDCQKQVTFNTTPVELTQAMCAIGNSSCTTSECVSTAARIISNMDTNVDPCDNFYNYVCGSYITKSRLPDLESKISTHADIIDSAYEASLSYMMEPIKPDDSKYKVVLKTLLQGCMKDDTIQKSVETLLSMMKDFGGWPVLNRFVKFDESKFSWIQTLYKIRSAGYAANYLVDVVNTVFSNKTHKIQVTTPTFEVNQLMVLRKPRNHPEVVAYYNYMIKMASLIDTAPNFRSLLNDTLDLAQKIVDLAVNNEGLEFFYRYNLELNYRMFPWFEYINNSMLHELTINVLGIETNVTYIQKMIMLLDKTPKRVIQSYIMWRVFEESVDFLPEKFRKERSLYQLSLKIPEPTQEYRCLKMINKKLPIALRALYVDRTYRKNWILHITEMALTVVSKMYIALEHTDMINSVAITKQAWDLVRNITFTTAYPYARLRNGEINRLFEGLDNLTISDLLGSALKLSLYADHKKYILLQKSVDEFCQVINQYWEYDYISWICNREVDIDALLLAAPWFSLDQPNFMTYGTIGWRFAYDLYKQIHPFLWKNQNGAYTSNDLCFNVQYHEYINNMYANANPEIKYYFTAMRIAYRAFQQYKKAKDEVQRLPGMEKYTTNQMIWIAAVESMCTVQAENLNSDQSDQENTQVHALVNVALSNIEEFSNDFQCAVGSKMHRPYPCTWL